MSKLTDYRALSFDVYGTLIDWETGILRAFEPLLSTAPPATRKEYTKKQILDIYHELEVAQQLKTPDMTYSQLLTTVHPQVATRLDLPEPTQESSHQFGQSIGSWPAFPDTQDALTRLSKHYKLIVLSNVDRESFAATNAQALPQITFDAILTAQDIGSYKPNRANFEYMLDQVDQKFGLQKRHVLQTAQSQFHDHHPASKMGIKSVWIVRPGGVMGNRSEEVYDWKFDTLAEMADAVDGEVGV